MPSLNDIKVQVETVPSEVPTGNVLPLLHEIRHALEKLVNQNEATNIDLRSLPLTTHEADTLLSLLGKGEIEAQLNALGRSLIWETRFSGVWVIEHYNADEALMTRLIEITWSPTIFKAHPEDVRDGMDRLKQHCSSP